MMSWGHDEYLYRVLKHHKATLPEEAFYMIRYGIQTHLLKRRHFDQVMQVVFMYLDSIPFIHGTLVVTMCTFVTRPI